jgi:hypothetical protein
VSRARKDSRLYRSPSGLGLTNGEWVTTGEEVGRWQIGLRSTVEDRPLYNLVSFRVRLTHRPDDGGSTHL